MVMIDDMADMPRVIKNAFRGRRKTTDTSVSCESLIKGLGQLPDDTTVNVVYYERIPGDIYKKDFFLGTPAEASLCLEGKFLLTPSHDSNNLYCDGRYQIFSGRSTEKHYIDVQYGYTSAGLSETDSFRLEPLREAHLSYKMSAGCRQFTPLCLQNP